ncbi:DUF4266 domain-containing protein, partial [Zunongwangia profunda]
MIKKVVILALIACSTVSCSAIKEYEKVYINDPDMVLGAKKVDRFQT